MESAKQSSTKKLAKPLQRLYRKPGALILTAAIVVVGGLLAVFLFPKGERINTSGYQVVYMATGQNFFGKLQNTSGEYLVLKNPYTAQDIATGSGKQPQTTLLKVSEQAYGPEDTMSLKSEQVLFWQNLRSDSKVTQAIENKQ